MPHPGVIAAAKDPKNGIVQPAELEGVWRVFVSGLSYQSSRQRSLRECQRDGDCASALCHMAECSNYNFKGQSELKFGARGLF